MSKPPLSISFHNFFPDFRPDDNAYASGLRRRYEVTVEAVGRDVQISSVAGRQLLPRVEGRQPLRVWSTGEAQDPGLQLFDLHFGFQPRSLAGPARWFRFPLWIRYIEWANPEAEHSIERLLAPRRFEPRERFCNFIYSNDVSIRAEFFLRLNRRRAVDSLGSVLNNGGRRLAGGAPGKLAALRRYRFTIAFENQISPGYVTEKLLHPLMAGSIPIYWGAREALTDFNPDAFVYAPDFPDFESLVEHVLALAEDEDRLVAMARAPVFRNNEVAYEHTPDFFADRIAEALAGDRRGFVPDEWRGLPFRPDGPKKARKRLSRAYRELRRRLLGGQKRSPRD